MFFVAYLRRWRHGKLTLRLQYNAVEQAVVRDGGKLIAVFVEQEFGRRSLAHRPSLETALKMCVPESVCLATLRWGTQYRDDALNVAIGRSAGSKSVDLPRPAVPKIKDRGGRPPVAKTSNRGFAHPARVDGTEVRARGHKTQQALSAAFYEKVRPFVAEAINRGINTPQALADYLSDHGQKTLRGKPWNRQSASNLLMRYLLESEMV